MNALYPSARRFAAVLVGAIALFGATAPAQAQSCETGTAEADLDINNVRATLYNIGGLFWRGSGAQYEVPKGAGVVSIFASGLWVGGEIGGNLHFAGSTYGPWEYWPGPLSATGTVDAATCAAYDRFWKVNFADVRDFNAGVQEGTVRGDDSVVNYSDLRSWPIAQGAPFYVDLNGDGRRNVSADDADGNVDGILNEPRQELDINDAGYGTRQIDLANNERPDIIGDQGIWWVMNDAGGSHDWSNASTIGIEVRAHAFAFRTADALNNTTFYRYQIIYRGNVDMDNTYIGIFSDPDLGNFNDDYVGSDPSLGLGFVYNGDAVDDNEYGQFPPALGYDFFQGPLVTDDGVDNDGDGDVDEADERLEIEKFFYFTNGGTVTSDPGTGSEAYSYMQGLWKDGTPLKLGGDGYNTNGPAVDFAFPGDPPGFWSEYNADGVGTANISADRRFGVSSGPFTFSPGEVQEIVFGIIWSQATGSLVQPQIQSVRKLKFDDRTAQAAFNAEFNLPDPPPGVDVAAVGLNQEIILEWDSDTGNINDIFTYEVPSPFAPASALDRTYNFEGFKVFQYQNLGDGDGTLIATFDIRNNITTVVDETLDAQVGAVVTGVTAQGEDNGTEFDTPTTLSITTDAFSQEALRNGTSYYFGIQTYAVNEASIGQKVFASPVTRVEVRPTLTGSVVTTVGTGASLEGVGADGNVGQGSFSAVVTNPAAVTGDNYRVNFYTIVNGDGDDVGTGYNVTNVGTGTVIFNGQDYYNETGMLPPQRNRSFEAEGLAFNVLGPADAITSFEGVANASGPIDPHPFAAAFAGFPTPGNANPTSGVQQSTNPVRWFFSTGNSAAFGGSFGDWLQRTIIGRGNEAFVFPNDFEMRFTGNSLAALDGIFGQSGTNPMVPFELWYTGIGTPDDASDDYRMIPVLLDTDGNGEWNLNETDSPQSSADNDPVTDWIYWYTPADETPGESGYLAWEASGNTGLLNHEVFGRTTIVGWNIGIVAADWPADRPEDGTIIRITTAKPNQVGDTFTITTGDAGAQLAEERSAAEQEAALDLMAITPNPYRGFSGYESSGELSVARFVNVPAQATIRIYTLSGTLVRSIEKNSPGSATIDWDLRTEAGLPVASGMYLIHIEARQSSGTVIGERVLKFGVIQRRSQLDVL